MPLKPSGLTPPRSVQPPTPALTEPVVDAVENATTTGTTSSPVSTTQDQFEARPSGRFVNHLLGLDTNADGQLTAAEVARGQETLSQLTSDGRGNDRVESALMLQIREAALPVDGQQNSTPAVEYRINAEGQLVFQRGDEQLASFAHEDHNNAGLSETLMEGTEFRVEHGDDPGDFYCEHMLFSSQQVASAPDSSVLENASGETLTGFLHVPSDDWTRQNERTGYTQAERHASSRKVIGAALRGYTNDILTQESEGPVRLLLTGYDRFSYVRNNPTGDFVSHRENLDAAMREAFGDHLLSAEGERVDGAVGNEGLDVQEGRTFRYQIRDPETGQPREVLLSTHLFAVDDRAISPQAEGSIQQVMERVQPQAVLSMGVAGQGAYHAEHRADSGGLRRRADGEATHDWNAPGRVQLRDNFSLARAIEQGAGGR